MTRSTIRTQILSLALFVALFASPAAAWSGHDGYQHWDRDEDDRDRNPSCWLEVRPNTVNYYGGQVTFEWESSDADWAEITDIGVVPTDGTMRVNVYEPKTYYMTVYADGRTSECETFVNVVGHVSSQNQNYYGYQQYQYPTYPMYQAPYVHLSQIPYTGFDFGPLGNAIYWMMLIGMAVVVAYLLVYQAGLRALASVPVVHDVVRAGRMQYSAVREVLQSSNAPAAAPAPVVAAAPVVEKRMSDSMQIVEGDTPRIVISRE